MIEDIELGPIEFILYECDYWVGLYLFGLADLILNCMFIWVGLGLSLFLG